jgi:hypothetical protein
MKKQNSFEEKKKFITGLENIFQTLLDKYVIPEFKEECHIYLKEEFIKVPKFTNIEYISQLQEEEKQNKIKKKLEKNKSNKKNIEVYLKSHLKETIIIQYDNTILDANFDLEIGESIKKIQEITDKIKQKQVEVLYYYILSGGYFNSIKETCENQGLSFKYHVNSELIEYKISMTYFLIKLYKKSNDFPRLQYLGVPIRYVQANWRLICEILEDDPVYWRNV